MANIPSAFKHLRQTAKRTERNRAAKSRLRTSVKRVRQALAAGNLEAATAAFRSAVALIDHTASRGIIHPRTAARYKSRLAQQLHARQGQATAR
jgi:small subunit ribosomal protein S20